MSYGTVQAEKMTTESGYSLGAGNASSFKNRIINGEMRIDQRNGGAAITINTTASAQFAVDRTSSYGTSSAGVFTAQRSTTAPVGFVNSLSSTVTTASTPSSTHEYGLRQTIEGFNIDDLGWGTANAKAVTLSFWVRSSVTGTFAGSVCNDAYNRSYVFTYTINSANTWEYETITIPGDTTGTWLTDNGAGIRLQLNLGAGSAKTGTAGVWSVGYLQSATGSINLISTSGATFFTTGWQLEVGTVATSFDTLPYGAEFALCQRYYQTVNMFSGGLVVDAYVNANDTYANRMLPFPVVMRAAPTGSLVATITYANRQGSETVAPYDMTNSQASIGIRANSLGRVYAQISSNNSLGNTYLFSAEYT